MSPFGGTPEAWLTLMSGTTDLAISEATLAGNEPQHCRG